MAISAASSATIQPKICLLTETFHPVIGGGETQARLLAEGLIAAGSSVVLLTRRSDASLARVEQFGQLTVYRLPPTGKGQLKKWGLLLSTFPKLVQLRHQYDLVFVSGFRIVGMAAVLASKALRKRCVLKADSLGEMSGSFFRAGLARVRMRPSDFPFRAFLSLRNWVLRRADAFAVITADIAAELIEAGVPEDALHMIPNSVDTLHFSPVADHLKLSLRRKLGLPLEHTIVAYTGRLVSYKGLPLLLKVWRELAGRHRRVSLLLIGTGGLDMHNCEDELKAYVAENNLQDTVHFTGSVSNVPEYLQASDVFVFPTEDDAFPSSVIEAMSCSLPVISTPVGAIKTIINHGHNGLLVNPGDYNGLLEALDTLLTDTTLAGQLGQAGRESVLELYSTEVVNRKYAVLFKSVAGLPRLSSAAAW